MTMMLSIRLRTSSCVAPLNNAHVCSKRPLGGALRGAALPHSLGLFSSFAVPVLDASTAYPSVLEQLDLEKARQGVAVLEQYGSQAANAAGAAIGGVLSPFQVFGDSWFLNFLFFGTLGLLIYSLLVLAPRQ